MHKTEVAAVLRRIGEMLEIKGENPFKVRAYYRAAQAVEQSPTEILEIHRSGKLQTLPGIGEGIAKKIAELLDTGKLDYYERLRKEIPPGMLDMLHIQGMGPKTVRLVYEKLKIADVAALERAAKAGKLRDLPRLGPKIEENILRGIEFLRRSSGRILLGKALPLAAELVQAVSKLPGVEKAAFGGSLRRMKETVADIDMLAVSNTPRNVMAAFVTLPQVKQVLAKGDTKSSILCGDPPLQVDLRVVERGSFGAALQYFTGSKEHNIKLRDLAVRKGLKLNEYGVFRLKDNRKVGGETEEEVYSLLGLAFIPPELREDRGEVEAAVLQTPNSELRTPHYSGRLPRLVTRADLRGDLHLHSDWTDGHDSIEKLAEAARALGYSYIAITDHTKSMAMTGGLTEKDILKQIEEIAKLNTRLKGIRVLTGIEVDILEDGKLDIPDRTLARLDVVIAAVHTRFKDSREVMTRRIVRALENEHVDILAHPTGRLIGERDAYEVDIERLFETAKKTGKALELNSFPDRLDLSDVHCRKAKEMGIPVAISTDAHGVSQLGLIEYGIATARRGWLEPQDVLNCGERWDRR